MFKVRFANKKMSPKKSTWGKSTNCTLLTAMNETIYVIFNFN